MADLMNRLRQTPPASFGETPVTLIGDYLKQTITENGETRATGLPASNVLYFGLKNGDVIVVRPSGTEPKVKFYYLLRAKDQMDAEAKIAVYLQVIDGFVNAE